MRATSFTAEELEELRRFDAEVDAAEMAEEDYGVTGLVDDLLFPQKAKERERKRAYYLANRERILEKTKSSSEENGLPDMRQVLWRTATVFLSIPVLRLWLCLNTLPVEM